MECYLKAEMEGATGIGRRMLSLWNDKNMFEMFEINVMNQARIVKKKGWLAAVEIEELKRKIEARRNDGSGAKMWKLLASTVKVELVVIGALGSILLKLKSYLCQLDSVLQKSALLGTAHILRKVLTV